MSCELKHEILKHDRMVPRYTSYPTAPHFKPGINHQSHVKELENIESDARISLYLHVPFCPKLCWYCGCNTKITKRYAPVEDYAHLLIREIEMLGDTLNGKKHVTNIHFGGGSPGMLRARDFAQIMETVNKHFSIDKNAEIALEIDPREITEGRIATYAKYGLNRASIGAQDFNENTLKAVNREQPFHLTHRTVELLRQYDINGINFDLLYGLPHQTPKTILETIEKAILLNPDRIAFFGYAHVPWMKKHMRLIADDTLPQQDARYDMFELGKNKLCAAGYNFIGIDHFAKDTDLLVNAYKNKTMRRNFQGYTTDNSDVMLGLGASSIGKTKNAYIQNAIDMSGYKKAILSGELPASKSCPISREDTFRSDIIEQIMCYGQIDLNKTCKKHGYPASILDKELNSLASWKEKGLVSISNDKKLSINDNARPMTRLVSTAFDAYLSASDTSTPRHAKAI